MKIKLCTKKNKNKISSIIKIANDISVKLKELSEINEILRKEMIELKEENKKLKEKKERNRLTIKIRENTRIDEIIIEM